MQQSLAVARLFHQELIQDTSRYLPSRFVQITMQVAQEGRGSSYPFGRDPGKLRYGIRPPRQIEQHLIETAMLPARVGVAEGQVGSRHPVDIGTGQMKEAQGVVWVGKEAKERDHQTYLIPVVQTLRPAEAPGDSLHVQCPEQWIGIAVSPNQNSDVAERARLRLDQFLDLSGDPVGLLLIGLEDYALNGRAVITAR